MAEARARFVLEGEDRTRAAFASVRRELAGVNSGALSLRNTLVGLGAGISVGAIVGSIRSIVNEADELNKLSQKVGVSVEALSEFQYGAKLAGVSTEELGNALRVLSTKVDAGSEAFKRLKLDPAQFKNNEDLLKGIAERFANIRDGAGKTAIAVELFGRAGANLIPLLNQGASGFKQFGDEARRLGIVIDGETARAAERFNDSLTRLGAGVRGLAVRLANDLLPAAQEIVRELEDGVRIAGSYSEALRLFGSINPVKSLAANIRELNEELARLEQHKPALSAEALFGEATHGTEGRIADVRKQLEFLRLQQQAAALAITKGRTDLDPRDIRAVRPRNQLEDVAPPEDKEALARVKREAERAKAERARTAKELDDYLKQLRERSAVDELELRVRYADERTDVERRAAEEQKKIEEDLDAYLLRLRKETTEDSIAVRERLMEATDKAAADEARAAQENARELGLVFTSAFEDAVLAGEKLSDVIKGLAQDIARVILRRTVTEPLANWVSTAIGGVLAGASARAGGGPVSANSPYWVGERGRELFVPSSSGTIVPNGAGGGITLGPFNIDARGATPGMELRIARAVEEAAARGAALVADRRRRGFGS